MEFDVSPRSSNFWDEERRREFGQSHVSWDAKLQLCEPKSKPKDDEHAQVWFQLRISATTMLCELAALQKVAGFLVYQYFHRMEGSASTVDLSKHLPHLWNTELMATPEIEVAGKKILSSFNPHQRAALDALRNIPDGIFFMTGCPGAWSKEIRQAGKNKEHKTQDMEGAIGGLGNLDIEDHEPRSRKEKFEMKAMAETTADPDFSRAFREQFEKAFQAGEKLPDVGGVSENGTVKETTTTGMDDPALPAIDTNKVLTLDQAAWQLFTRQPEPFSKLRQKMHELKQLYTNPHRSHKPCSDSDFQESLLPLYKEVLAMAHFIATTPVAAAHPYFSHNWQPDLVFFDEVAHTREASTLIPLAFQQKALAYIYLGDPKQSSPSLWRKRSSEYRPFREPTADWSSCRQRSFTRAKWCQTPCLARTGFLNRHRTLRSGSTPREVRTVRFRDFWDRLKKGSP